MNMLWKFLKLHAKDEKKQTELEAHWSQTKIVGAATRRALCFVCRLWLQQLRASGLLLHAPRARKILRSGPRVAPRLNQVGSVPQWRQTCILQHESTTHASSSQRSSGHKAVSLPRATNVPFKRGLRSISCGPLTRKRAAAGRPDGGPPETKPLEL